MIRSKAGKFPAPLVALVLLVSSLAPGTAAQRSPRRAARRPPPRPAATPRVAADGDARLRRIADEYLRGHFAFRPAEATAAGLHEYDAQLDTRAPEAVAREVRRLRAALAELQRVPEWRLTPEARYDYLVLQSHARAQLLELEEVRAWRRDPNLYNRLAAEAIDNVLKREYAPGERRLDAMMARARQIPRLLSEARANVENPPRLYTETAIAEARGSLDFFARVVPQLVERAGGGRLTAARRAEIDATNESVVAAVRSFVEWLETDLLARSDGDFRLGAELFRRKLLYEEMIDTPPAALLRAGEEELRRTQEAMRAVAEEVAPGRGLQFALQSLGRERPTAAGLAGDARAELGRLRAFVRAEGIMTPPTRERLAVTETPEYARALSYASLAAPGPFERASDDAFYYVTPPDPARGAVAAEEHLSHFNRYALQIISIHEAYPGHYYQQLSLARTPSRVRTALGSASFVEGWAHYCEQMMIDEGFGGNNPKLRLAQLHAALVGLCRYLAAVRLHTEGMTYEQAVEFFVREGHLPRSSAEREARRGALDPTCLSHTLGKMEITRLREEWRRQMGDSFRLGEFHDRLLSYGMPPVKILRMAMLGDAGGVSGGVRGLHNVGTGGGVDSSDAVQGEQSVPVEFSVIASGQMSGYEGARRVGLVTNDAEWRRVWETIGEGRPVPEVNFDTRAVVLAYQGRQATGGHGIEIAGVRRVGTVLAVKVNERRPASGDITTQVLTSPYVAATIPRPPSGAQVRFDEPAAAGPKPLEPKGFTKTRGRAPRRTRRRGR